MEIKKAQMFGIFQKAQEKNRRQMRPSEDCLRKAVFGLGNMTTNVPLHSSLNRMMFKKKIKK